MRDPVWEEPAENDEPLDAPDLDDAWMDAQWEIRRDEALDDD